MTKQAILLSLFLPLSGISFQVTAEMVYETGHISTSVCSWPNGDKPSTDSTTSSATSKPYLNPDSITVSKDRANEVGIHIPNAMVVADTGKRIKTCVKGSRFVFGPAFVPPPGDDSTEVPPESKDSINPVLELFTADFFIMEISITGDGSGMVITSEKSYTSEKCSSESCEEWHPMVEESEVKTGSRPETTRDSADSDSPVAINNVKAEPNSDSSLVSLNCDEPQQGQRVLDGQTKGAIVVHCTAVFKLVEVSVSPPSIALDKDGNFLDTATTFLGKVANPAGPKKDDEDMIILHSPTEVKITGTITVDSLHLGQSADMLTVVALAPTGFDGSKSFYMGVGDGNQFKPWNGDTATLSAVQDNVLLEKEQTLEIYQGSLIEAWYEVYFGYRLEEGTIVFNKEPLKIEVGSEP